MPILRLRPWPFKKNENVRLYWLCSPYKAFDGNWLIKAVFLREATSLPEIVEYPWGTLPALRIGRIYVDGLLNKSTPENLSERVFIPNVQNGTLCKAFDLPKSLYNFFQNPTFGREKLWRFRVNQIIYYIPCLELVRAFLAPSKTLANQILKPHGLDSLIEEESLQDDILTIHLSGIIPRTLVNDQTVAHLVWLYYENTARECWESIYRNIFAEAIQLAPIQPTMKLVAGIPLSIKPPLSGSCELHFKGIFYKHLCLMVEILGARGLPILPFQKIVYTHPSLKKRNSDSSSGVSRKVIPKENQDPLELDTTNRSARNESYQPLADMDVTSIEFSHLPLFMRGSSDDVKGRGGSTSAGTREGKTYIKVGETTVSTNEMYYGGEIRPVEFVGLHLCLSENTNGLEDFLQAVRHIIANYSQPSLKCSVVEIPGNRSFCHFPNGSKRNCAVVEIRQDGISPSFILEIARPDLWFISTLLIQIQASTDTAYSIEKQISDLLEDAVKGDGHWNIERLEQSSSLKAIRLKHINNQSPWVWSKRILDKLSLFDFTPEESSD